MCVCVCVGDSQKSLAAHFNPEEEEQSPTGSKTKSKKAKAGVVCVCCRGYTCFTPSATVPILAECVLVTVQPAAELSLQSKPKDRSVHDIQNILTALEVSAFAQFHPQRIRSELAQKLVLTNIPKDGIGACLQRRWCNGSAYCEQSLSLYGFAVIMEEEFCDDVFIVWKGCVQLSRAVETVGSPVGDDSESSSQHGRMRLEAVCCRRVTV